MNVILNKRNLKRLGTDDLKRLLKSLFLSEYFRYLVLHELHKRDYLGEG